MTKKGKLRVCLIAPHFAEYSFAFARALSDHADVLVVANSDNTINEINDEIVAKGCDGLQTHFFRKTRNPFSIALQAVQLVLRVRAFAPDVLHIQEDSKDVLALALPFLGKTPLLLTIHDPKPHSGDDTRVRNRTRHGIYIEQLRRRANAVLVHGDSLVADARTVIGRDAVPVYVAPHGPLGQGLHGVPRPSRELGRCLFFGRIEAYKGLGRFIDVVERLNERGISVRGVVAGRGSDLELHRHRLNPDLFELIEKFLTPEEVVNEFYQADLVLMPYENATQSGVAAYAIGVGRPAVVFDVGALSEMVYDGITGVVVPPGDLAALTMAAGQLITDRELNARLSANALKLGQTEFSWAAISGRLCSIYLDLASNSSSSHQKK